MPKNLGTWGIPAIYIPLTTSPPNEWAYTSLIMPEVVDIKGDLINTVQSTTSSPLSIPLGGSETGCPGQLDLGCRIQGTNPAYQYILLDYNQRMCDHGYKVWEWINYNYIIRVTNARVREDKSFHYSKLTILSNS